MRTTSLMRTFFITNSSELLAFSSSQLNRSLAKWTRAVSRKIANFRWTRIFITNPLLRPLCNALRESRDAKLSGIFIRRFISRSYPGPCPRECRTRKTGTASGYSRRSESERWGTSVPRKASVYSLCRARYVLSTVEEPERLGSVCWKVGRKYFTRR